MGILEGLFLANCGVTVASYLPQLVKLLKDRTDSSSISIGSWLIWVYTAAVGFIYALFQNGDFLFILSTGSTMLFCAIVLGLTAFNRHLKFKIAGKKNISILEMISSYNVVLFIRERQSQPVRLPVKVKK